MARLIKAVARCGLRFESGLPHGAKERVGLYIRSAFTCICAARGPCPPESTNVRETGSKVASERKGEIHEGIANSRVEHIRWV